MFFFRLPSRNGTKDWAQVPACLEQVFTTVQEKCYEPLNDHSLRNFSNLSTTQILYSRQIPKDHDEVTARAAKDLAMSLNHTCSMSKMKSV